MWQNIKLNRFWFLTGLETVALGMFFVAMPDYIPSIDRLGGYLGIFDDNPAAVLIIITGTLGVIVSSFQMSPDIHRGMSYVEEALWTFYATIMLMRDVTNPNQRLIGLATIFIIFVAARIAAEIWIAEPTKSEVELQSRIKELNQKIDDILKK